MVILWVALNMMFRHKLLGSARLSVNQLTVQKIRSQLLVLEKKSRKETGGALHFLKAECKREFTWLDFVKGGCVVFELYCLILKFNRMQLEFAVAIDFTASNGDINQPGTRHYIDQFCLNQVTNKHYQSLINSFCSSV